LTLSSINFFYFKVQTSKVIENVVGSQIPELAALFYFVVKEALFNFKRMPGAVHRFNQQFCFFKL
jgi:hypothetical protein